MMVCYNGKSMEEIANYEKSLIDQGYFEFENFWNIDELWKDIKGFRNRSNKKCFALFNDKFILIEENENITEDDLYKYITGKSKQENILASKKWLEEQNKKKEDYDNKIPKLVIEYREKLKNVLDEKYYDKIDKYLEDSLRTIYREYLIESLIEIIGYSKDKTLEEIEKKLLEQGHSGMSFNIVIKLFKEFSDKGKEFYQYYIEKENKHHYVF